METKEPFYGSDENRDFSEREDSEINYNRRDGEYERRPRFNPNRWDNDIDNNESSQYGNDSRRQYHRNDDNNSERPRFNRYNNGSERRQYNSYNSDNNQRPRFAGQRPRINRYNNEQRSFDENTEQRPRFNRYNNQRDNNGYTPRPRYNNDENGQQQYVYSSDGSSDESRPRVNPRGQRPRINRNSNARPYNNNGRNFNRNNDNGNQQRRPRFNNKNNNAPRKAPKVQKSRFALNQKGKNAMPENIFIEDVMVETPEVAAQQVAANLDKIRLNRFIAMAGICSRREADDLIKAGKVKVNGEVITEMGVIVNKTDNVEYEGNKLVAERKVYVLLNKPKDTVTTTDDPEERRTVMDLVSDACNERIVPVGRLDRNTTGVLLITNDGDLTEKLTHPKYGVRKIYHVFLDKNVTEADMQKMLEGIELEDGPINVDDIRYVDVDHKQVGVQIHSGRNRIVRRIFEHFGYEVEKLDRVYFAGLTKLGIPRGHWRYLTDTEINKLKAGFFK